MRKLLGNDQFVESTELDAGNTQTDKDLMARAAHAGFNLVTRETDTGQRVWEWQRGTEPRPQFVIERVALVWMSDWLEDHDATESHAWGSTTDER